MSEDPNSTQEMHRGQPMREIERDGVHYTLLGTAHVSRSSAEVVAAPQGTER